MSVNEVQQSVREILENCKLSYIDIDTIQKALTLNDKYGYAYYDCLILASALFNDCANLYSEDMQHNQLIEGKLTITNPFRQGS
jgi:predicted nucleic acid-binding protein